MYPEKILYSEKLWYVRKNFCMFAKITISSENVWYVRSTAWVTLGMSHTPKSITATNEELNHIELIETYNNDYPQSRASAWFAFAKGIRFCRFCVWFCVEHALFPICQNISKDSLVFLELENACISGVHKWLHCAFCEESTISTGCDTSMSIRYGGASWSCLKVHTSDHEWPRMTTSDHE
jgi:hypothetical protein